MVSCPGSNNPLGNYSSEAFDGLDYLATQFYYGGSPLGQDWTSTECGVTYVSQISQADADIQAAVAAALCAFNGDYPPGDSNSVTPFFNEAIGGMFPCPNGTFTFFQVPAGLFPGINQLSADETARHFAYSESQKFLCCISSLPPYACLGQMYNQFISISGGTAPGLIAGFTEVVNWTLLNGTLPPGLTFTGGLIQQAEISGTPTTEGSYTFTVEAATVEGTFSIKSFTICVANITAGPAETSPGVLPDATLGTAYEESFDFATCVTEEMLWQILNVDTNPLPPGLSLEVTTGIISGTPTAAGTYNFEVQASQVGTTDGYQFVCDKKFQVTVGGGTDPVFGEFIWSLILNSFAPSLPTFNYSSGGIPCEVFLDWSYFNGASFGEIVYQTAVAPSPINGTATFSGTVVMTGLPGTGSTNLVIQTSPSGDTIYSQLFNGPGTYTISGSCPLTTGEQIFASLIYHPYNGNAMNPTTVSVRWKMQS